MEISRQNASAGWVAPSMLSADFSRLADEVKDVENAGAEVLHIDVMDGHFVPNLTIGAPVVKCLETKMIKDCHLMVTNPQERFKEFASAGADIITFHTEVTDQPRELIKQVQDMGCKAGISLNPATELDQIESVLDVVDLVLVMSVVPGFGGQSFIETSYDKIEQLVRMGGDDRKFLIEVDGGVKADNTAALRKSGVDIFVAGSAVFNHSDRKEAVAKIRKEIG